MLASFNSFVHQKDVKCCISTLSILTYPAPRPIFGLSATPGGLPTVFYD